MKLRKLSKFGIEFLISVLRTALAGHPFPFSQKVLLVNDHHPHFLTFWIVHWEREVLLIGFAGKGAHYHERTDGVEFGG